MESQERSSQVVLVRVILDPIKLRFPALLTRSQLFVLNASKAGRLKHRSILAEELFGVQSWPICAAVWGNVEPDDRELAALHHRMCPFSVDLLRATSEGDVKKLAGNGMNLNALAAFVAFVLSQLVPV